MRYLYVYNPYASQIIDKQDVTGLAESDVELRKIDMILSTKFPLEVLDSEADGAPPLASQPYSANVATDNVAG
jgi:hypothetical protein